jgi:hypothetical protein
MGIRITCSPTMEWPSGLFMITSVTEDHAQASARPDSGGGLRWRLGRVNRGGKGAERLVPTSSHPSPPSDSERPFDPETPACVRA